MRTTIGRSQMGDKDFSNIFMEHQRVQKSRFYLKFLRDPKQEKSGKFFRHFDEPLKGTNFEGFFKIMGRL